jgi:hypothetical protein
MDAFEADGFLPNVLEQASREAAQNEVVDA